MIIKINKHAILEEFVSPLNTSNVAFLNGGHADSKDIFNDVSGNIKAKGETLLNAPINKALQNASKGGDLMDPLEKVKVDRLMGTTKK